MTLTKISVFSICNLNKIEENVISDVAQNFGIKNINYRCIRKVKRTYIESVITSLLDREANVFKKFLLSQDSERRTNLYENVPSYSARANHGLAGVGIFLFNPKNDYADLSKLSAYYYIELGDSFAELNAYILDCVVRRMDFIEIRGFEVLNSGVHKQFKISCQVVELYIVSLFKVYATLIQKITSMASKNDIHLC